MNNLKKKIVFAVVIAAAVILAVILFLLKNGKDNVYATTMRVIGWSGDVSLSEDDKERTLLENMLLHSGDRMRTAERALADILLDATKVVGLDESSQAEFVQEKKKLKVELEEGSLYFYTTKAVADDEVFEIHTSTMMVGVRGTSGYVSVDRISGETMLHLISGEVEVVGINPETGAQRKTTIRSGQVIHIRLDNDKKGDESVILDIESMDRWEDIPCLLARRILAVPDVLVRALKESKFSKEEYVAAAYGRTGGESHYAEDQGINLENVVAEYLGENSGSSLVADILSGTYEKNAQTGDNYAREGENLTTDAGNKTDTPTAGNNENSAGGNGARREGTASQDNTSETDGVPADGQSLDSSGITISEPKDASGSSGETDAGTFLVKKNENDEKKTGETGNGSTVTNSSVNDSAGSSSAGNNPAGSSSSEGSASESDSSGNGAIGTSSAGSSSSEGSASESDSSGNGAIGTSSAGSSSSEGSASESDSSGDESSEDIPDDDNSSGGSSPEGSQSGSGSDENSSDETADDDETTDDSSSDNKVYNVNLPTDLSEGNVTASTQTAKAGDAVTLTVSDLDGYELSGQPAVKDTSGANISVAAGSGAGSYVFIMPESDITVSAAFKKSAYVITVLSGDNGTVVSDAENQDNKAVWGSTVTLTVRPNLGYSLNSLQIRNGDTEVAYTKLSDRIYTFEMPKAAVGITADYAAAYESELTMPQNMSDILAELESSGAVMLRASESGGNTFAIDEDMNITSGTLIIDKGVTMAVSGERTLTISEGAAIINGGTITNNGKIINNGTFENVSATTLNNNGILLVDGNGVLINTTANIVTDGAAEYGRIVNAAGGHIIVTACASFVNDGAANIENAGFIDYAGDSTVSNLPEGGALQYSEFGKLGSSAGGYNNAYFIVHNEDSRETIRVIGWGDMDTNSGNTDYSALKSFKDNAESIVVEDGITSVKDSVFTSFNKTESVSIGNGVTKIGSYAFKDCSSLEEFYFGTQNALTEIGSYAFYGDAKLKSLDIPEGVTRIGNRAFGECMGLTSVYIPKSLTGIYQEMSDFKDFGLFYSDAALTTVRWGDGIETIVGNLFADCPGLTSINIPDTVKTVGANAFKNCGSLKEIHFDAESSLTTIDNYAFGGTDVTSVTIPDTVTTIGDFAFRNCGRLKEIHLGTQNKLKRIGSGAFYEDTELTAVTIPEGVTEIGNRAFGGCTGLTSVYIPKTLKSTFQSFSDFSDICPFYGDTELSAVTWGDGIEIIAGSLFAGCPGLTSVTIPDTVATIGSYAFSSCANLRVISFGDESRLKKIENHAFYKDTGLTDVAIPDGVTNLGANAFGECTGLTTVSIPKTLTTTGTAFNGDIVLTTVSWEDGTTTIPDDLFRDCAGLISITIPETVTTIGSSAFRGTSLTSITIPATVKTIGSYAFSECTSMSEIIFGSAAGGSSLKEIANYAFYKDTGLTNVVIPEGVTTLGIQAFGDCTNLTAVSIPQTLTTANSLYGGPFGGDTALTAVTLQTGINTIPNNLFNACTGLTSITIPETVTTIGNYAFCSTGLTSITIPNTVKTIGESAFESCKSLQTVSFEEESCCETIGRSAFKGTSITGITIPGKVKKIDNFAFSECTGLTEIHYGDQSKLTTIGDYAFSNDAGLTQIDIPEGVTTAGVYVFRDCTGLTTVSIPRSMTTIGNYAFHNCSSLTTVNYQGNESEWEAIKVGNNNEPLANAQKNYNYNPD